MNAYIDLRSLDGKSIWRHHKVSCKGAAPNFDNSRRNLYCACNHMISNLAKGVRSKPSRDGVLELTARIEDLNYGGDGWRDDDYASSDEEISESDEDSDSVESEESESSFEE